MSEMTGEPQESETGDPAASTSSESVMAENPANTSGSASKSVWAIALIFSAALAVSAINFSPSFFELPSEYESIDPSSSPEQQEAASQAYILKEWKNTLSSYALAGLCLALPCVIASRRYGTGGAIGASVLSMIFGLLCGLVAVSLGTIVAEQMRIAGYDVESMAPDILAWGAMSAVLALPATVSLIISGEKPLSQRVVSTPLAGILTGIIVTIGVSLFLPSANTSKIPPFGFTLTAVWFAVLIGLILVLSTFTGSRKPKVQSVDSVE